MQSIFRYPGGKTKANIQKWILAHRPPGTREYREPFVGGGGIFFALKGVESRWINDRHEGLIEVYRALLDRPAEFIQACKAVEPERDDDELAEGGPRGGKQLNQRLKDVFDSVKLNPDCDQAFRYYFINRTVHGSGRVNYDIPSRLYFSNPAGWNVVANGQLEKAAQHVAGTRITCGDYEAVFSEPGEDVWIYADPPYVVNSNLTASSQLYQHSFTMDDHRRLAEVAARCKHKVCISYDDDDEGVVRSLYPQPKFNIIERHWHYCGTTNETKDVGLELLILNYDPPREATLFAPNDLQQSGVSLTADESGALIEHEREIEAGINGGREAYLRIGRALAAIRDSGRPSRRLYRATHVTFESYCRDTWGLSEARATQLIVASKRYEVLETLKIFKVLPRLESHVAQLARCETDEQAAEVWQKVVDTVDDPQKIKAKTIREHVNEVLGVEPPEEKSPYEHLLRWWKKADAAAQHRFKLFLEGIT